jgi:O-methyltransferase
MLKKIGRRLSNLFLRTKWFANNYYKIQGNSQILPSHLVEGATYNTDGLITSNNCDFIEEPRFSNAYLKAAQTNPWPHFTLQWRVYVVCWFADHVKELNGDYIECGVNTGAYSRAIIEYIKFNDLKKNFYLLDTFDGLVESLISEDERKQGITDYLNSYKNVFDQVKNTFRDFNVKIIKGVVPETLQLCDAKQICYLSLDMNCVAPEIAAINYFWDKIVTGGVILLDDYGFPKHIHQKKAFDAFAKEKQVEILSLPTGQGIIIKK